jgi:hypothetical protein
MRLNIGKLIAGTGKHEPPLRDVGISNMLQMDSDYNLAYARFYGLLLTLLFTVDVIRDH